MVQSVSKLTQAIDDSLETLKFHASCLLELERIQCGE